MLCNDKSTRSSGIEHNVRVALDTSAYSAFLRGHEGIADRLRYAPEIALNTVVIGELLAGFRRGPRWQQNLGELERFRSSPRVTTISLDEETAHRYSEIVVYLRNSGTPIPTNDIWIAASAMQYGLRVITTDSHFERVPQVLAEIFST